MVRHVAAPRKHCSRRRTPLITALLLGANAACCWCLARSGQAFAGLPRVAARGALTPTARGAEAEVIDVSDEGDGRMALMKLEASLEQQIAEAKSSDNPNRLRDLARLLVLAKTAEGIAASEMASDASGSVQQAVAESLADFVGKEEYEFGDVTKAVNQRCAKAVAALDDIYIEDIQREMNLAGQAAVTSFTGKEEYEFGDISSEVATRAKGAVSSFTGKEDYKFGDITKEAMKRGGDAVKDFTGKEDYQFGDITKTVLKNIFGGDDDKKK